MSKSTYSIGPVIVGSVDGSTDGSVEGSTEGSTEGAVVGSLLTLQDASTNEVNRQNSMRVTTSVVNEVINEAIAVVQPPSDKGRRLKILYGTQAGVRPPTFVVFVNDKKLCHFLKK